MFKKVLLMFALVGISSTIYANPLKGLWENWRINKLDEVKATVDEIYKSVEKLTDYEKSEAVLYYVAVRSKKKEITADQILTTVDQKAKEIGLTDEKSIFRVKGIVSRGWWNGLGSDALFVENAKAYKDKLDVWVTEDYSKWDLDSTYFDIVIKSYIVLGDNQTAFDFAKKNKSNSIMIAAKNLGPEKVLEAANYELLESDKELKAADVDNIVTIVLDKCYASKYDQAVKELLTGANNKYYKNIGKSADWKAACTTIQLGLKRFDK